MKPFVKWAGGKRQILGRIRNFVENSLEQEQMLDEVKYVEPFLGGGAVFFDLHPKKAIINDLNEDLMRAYKVIKSDDYVKLIELLEEYQRKYKEEDKDELYYSTREKDRTDEWKRMNDVEKAARMIFLNRTCFNGLYRVNSKGQFNTPMGRYNNPTICDKALIIEIHEYLKSNEIKIMCGDYKDCIKKAYAGDIVYVDPPYDYEDDDGFTKYQMQGFTFDDFVKLKIECDKALKRGAFVIISNNATDRVIKLFLDDVHYKVYSYDCNKFGTLRSINCKGDSRNTGFEVIFWGIPNFCELPQANDIKKVIKLLLIEDEAKLKDNAFLMDYLGLGTERQVAYYLAALKFFQYLNNELEFTDHAKQIKVSEDEIVKDIINQLYKNEIFKYLIENKIENVDEITRYLKKKKYRLSDSTLKRRASTIKKWIEFVLENQ